MACQVREVLDGCLDLNKQRSADHEANMSTASTDDVASDSLTDDEEAPAMLPLERHITFTEYNEVRSCEWQEFQSGGLMDRPVETLGLPHVQPACYMVPPPPSYVAPLSMLANSLDYSVPVVCVAGSAARSFCQYSTGYSQQHQCATAVHIWNAHENNYVEEDNSDWCARLAAGGKQREQVLGALRGKVAELAFQQLGCRIVQDALQVAGTDAARLIVDELHGHVQAAAWSPHANYVIQKVIEVLPTSLSAFVARELHGVASSVARGKYGCRILCRIFEYGADQPESRKLADELFKDAGALCRHAFAHHVMEVILKHGLLEQRQSVVNALIAEFWASAQSESSSYVIESAIVHCTEEEMSDLVAIIAKANPGKLVSLLNGKPGSRVLRALLRVLSQSSNDALRVIVGVLQRGESQCALSWQGKRLVQEFSKEVRIA